MTSQDPTPDDDPAPAPARPAPANPYARMDADTIVDGGAELPQPGVSGGSLQPGTRLGRYVVLEEIGQGGMGMVFAAYDPELNRKVALKLMRPNQRELKRKKNRLLKEAQALAKLAHPNVITVYDVGTLDDRVFVAMELVEGDTLKGWLKASKRRWSEILSVFVQSGRGLAAAHAASLIHRDFKPDNVLIGGDGRVRVMDFGLARPTHGKQTGDTDDDDDDDDDGNEDADEESSPGAKLDSAPPVDAHDAAPRHAPTDELVEPLLTQTGSIMGTPAYMAPEQHTGKTTDARSDQFSFCTSLYHGLYGARPFDGDDVGALMRQKLAFSLAPTPSGNHVPAWVRRAVLRGLSPEPADRWPTMDALLDELGNDPRVARRKWLSAAVGALIMVGSVVGVQYYRGQRPDVCGGFEAQFAEVWNAERKAAVSEALPGGLAAGADAAWITTAWDKLQAAVDGYGEQWIAMSTEACQATHVRGEQSPRLLGLRQNCLDERLAEVDALADILADADEAVTARALQASMDLSTLSRCADSEALAAAVDPPQDTETKLAVAEMRGKLARVKVLDATGRTTEAATLAQEMFTMASKLEYPPAVAEARFRLGTVEGSAADVRPSEDDLQESAWLAASVKHDTIAASAATELVRVVGLGLDKHHAGLGWARHAEAAVKRIGLGGMDEAVLHHYVGEIHAADHNWDQATQSFDAALTIYEKLPRTQLRVAALLRNLGDVRIGQRRWEDAEDFFERARVLLVDAAGPAHPVVARAISGLGRVAAARGNGEAAHARYKTALALVEAAVGARSVQLAPIYQDIARTYVAEADYASAIENHARALRIMEPSLGAHPRVARALHELGRTRLVSGDRPRARQDYDRALQIWEASRGKDHPDLAFGLTQIALLDLEEQQPKQAIERLERALKVRGRKGLRPVLLADTQFALARALSMSGEDKARARELANKAREAYAAAGSTALRSVDDVDQWLATTARDNRQGPASPLPSPGR